MHLAVLNADIETVLSLLSVNVNVNSRVQDSIGKTGLHIAAEIGSEMIIRNLVKFLEIFLKKFNFKLP